MAKIENVYRVLSAIPSPPPKFTLSEWHLNNHFRYQSAKAQQELSDRLLAEATRECHSTAEVVKINKEETDHHLEEKLNDIEFRKKELLHVRKEIVLEIDALSMYKERISDALKSVKRNAHEICQKCLTARKRRLDIDLVHDDVERELVKELEVIKEAQSSLEQVLGETHEQIRKLKAALYYIDHDLENKENNLRIERHNASLKETSPNLSICHDISRITLSVITVDEWELQTDNNIISANRETNAAKQLRCHVDTLIKKTIDGLNKQKDVTNEALRQRIQQTRETKMKLELQHSEIVKQVTAMTSKIKQIKQCIADKESYMALAHTRLGHRYECPGIEHTQDSVEVNLVKEIQDLRKVVTNLQQLLREAETSLRYLLRTQMQLEQDINIKTNTLKIDEVECTILRQSMDYRAY